MRPELVKIAYSPWSLRACWALDHHRVPHDRSEFLPMLGEPALRLRMGRPFTPVTLPVMFIDGGMLDDSFTIAEYAERHGRGEPLFPSGQHGRIRHYNERAQRIMAAGRICATARTLRSPQALKEALPKPLAGLGPVAVGIARQGAQYLAYKYRFSMDEERARTQVIAEELAALRRDLDASGGHLCGDGFSYADILMAVALQFVRPVDHPSVRLRKASRACWGDDDLASEYADLLAWRDDLYARFRG